LAAKPRIESVKLPLRVASSSLLALGALACIALSLHLMYEAGCTGDIKGGSVGDIPRALTIESGAVSFAWGGTLLAALIAAAIPRITALQRVLGAVIITLLGITSTTYLGVSAEVRGVQTCLIEK
jgi:hypothetical protein